VTVERTSALRAHHVTDITLAREASDHLTVTVKYLPAVITMSDLLSYFPQLRNSQ
jgi:hypothetical protein